MRISKISIFAFASSSCIWFSSNPMDLSCLKYSTEETASHSTIHKNTEGDTGLLAAAASGNIVACCFLLEAGAHVNARDSEGHTPFMVALLHGHLDICKLLRQKGAHVNTQDLDEQDLTEEVKPLFEPASKEQPRKLSCEDTKAE